MCESSTNEQILTEKKPTKPLIKITEEDITKLNKEYNNIKINNRIYYDDIEAQEKLLSNYKEFLAELQYQLNDLKDQLNISVYKEKIIQNILTQEENTEILNNLEIISNNINEFQMLIEKQKNLFKHLEYNYKKIQEKFNEIKENYQNELDSIEEQLKENKNIENSLKQNKLLYEQKKKEIEKNIQQLQGLTE